MSDTKRVTTTVPEGGVAVDPGYAPMTATRAKSADCVVETTVAADVTVPDVTATVLCVVTMPIVVEAEALAVFVAAADVLDVANGVVLVSTGAVFVAAAVVDDATVVRPGALVVATVLVLWGDSVVVVDSPSVTVM